MTHELARLVVVSGLLTSMVLGSIEAAQRPAAPDVRCRIAGRVTGAGVVLPGVSLTARAADGSQSVTASGVDGSFRLPLAAGAYVVSAELTGFAAAQREVTLSDADCEQAMDIALSLAPRASRAGLPPVPSAGRAGGRGRTAAVERFAALAAVNDAAAEDAGLPDTAVDSSLLPPGFAAEAAADAIAVTGDIARLDRGQLEDRIEAIARGEVVLGSGAAPGAFGQDAPAAGRAGDGRDGAPPGGRGGGRGAGPAAGRAGGAGGPAGAARGGLARGGQRVTATANYTFGGSVLDSTPYELRPGSSSSRPPYTQQNFGVTLGGPVKLPGVYDGTRRTTFTLGYTGGRGDTLFDRYATVPTAGMRAGDLSGVPTPLIDPLTGAAFAGNQIPLDRISPQAQALLGYIPLPNLAGDTRNYHYSTPTASLNDSLNLRVTHNFAAPAAGAGPAGRGGGGRGGGRGNNASLNAQVQYRRQDANQPNVFATLGGLRESTTLGVPVTLNVSRARTQHSLGVNLSRTTSSTSNRFSGVQDVAGRAGISGASPDPFAWGVPALSFASITGIRDVTPSARRDRRFSATYSWQKPLARHSVRLGGEMRLDRSTSHTESNASGSFLFTGLATSGGRAAGADFADFLLGLPQQASVQYGPGEVTMLSRSMSLFVLDDWRMRPNLTLNAGVRYELLWPYVEENGHLVNLDVPDDFSNAAPVVAGGSGAFTGEFPAGLLLTDRNNLAPRIGFAWRSGRGFVTRGGYGVSYNAGAYAAIARQLASQPPFAVTSTRIAELNALLLLENALDGESTAATTNNFGVDKDYALGLVQTWNVDVARALGQGWNVSAGYTHTRGSSLDILRAPNRDADGVRIEGVEPFLWQSSEGSSVLNSAVFRLQRRQVRGLGGQITYTLARSRDNAPSIGGGSGSSVVAQDDRDLDAEWGLSNFDRRHRLTGSLTFELPFGANRPWLSDGGPWAAALSGWRVSATFTAESGAPLTARVQAGTRDAAQGINGALRADYSGADLGLDDPSVDRFFNTAAFSVPGDGIFGSSPRNIILGPGSRQLDGQVSRDVRLGGTRALTVQLRANNVLNLVNYLAVDTSVNSPTFGQILSVRPRRSAQLNLRFRF